MARFPNHLPLPSAAQAVAGGGAPDSTWQLSQGNTESHRMTTEDDKKFAYRDYSNYVVQATYHVMVNVVKLGDPRFGGVGQGFAGALPGPAWLSEPRRVYLKVKIPKSREEEMIEVIIGAREGW